jgi:metal-responsive CopG/Arc/MetJ family transcriptional regulator
MSIGTVRKICISIPEPILKDLQDLVPERKRSEYIVKALQEKIEDEKMRRLREKMIAGYKVNAAPDAEMAEEWRLLEEEADALMGVREPQKQYGRRPRGSSLPTP